MSNLNDSNVLVTGGAGFIGSHIAEALLQRGAFVTVLDNFSTGRRENLSHLRHYKHLKILKENILDKNAMLKVLSDFDLTYHFAAELEITKGLKDPATELQTNALGTLNVLEAMRTNDLDNLVYASSAGVYGQALYLPQDEKHPLNPHWPYGVSKLAGEKYCTAYFNLYGLRTVSLRFSIVYGPREWYRRVLTRFIKRVLEEKAPIVFGDGKQTRDFVHVKDAADAAIHASSTAKKAAGKIFNVGSGRGTSISDLANMVIRFSGKKMETIYMNPKAGEMGRKPGELLHLTLDITKAKNELGYSPSIQLDEGIEDFINWARVHHNRWWPLNPANP